MMKRTKSKFMYKIKCERNPDGEKKYRFNHLSPPYTGHVGVYGAWNSTPDTALKHVEECIESQGSTKKYVEYLYDVDMDEVVSSEWMPLDELGAKFNYLSWVGSPYIEKVYCRDGKQYNKQVKNSKAYVKGVWLK